MTGFLRDPALPAPLDLSMVDPALLADAPGRLLALAGDLLLSGDTARGGEYLDLLERAQPPVPPESRLAARFAAMRSVRYALTGQLTETVARPWPRGPSRSGRSLTDNGSPPPDDPAARLHAGWRTTRQWNARRPRLWPPPSCPNRSSWCRCPGRGRWPGSRAATWPRPLTLPGPPMRQARRLGFGQHFFAVDHLRTLAGLALERRDLDAAEQLTEQALSISEHGRPTFEFLALLDRAAIWAARGQVRDALATVEAARLVLAGTRSVLLARADELEALLRLSLGDLALRRSWPAGCPPPAAACCWPGSRSPPAITTPRRNICRRRRWPT